MSWWIVAGLIGVGLVLACVASVWLHGWFFRRRLPASSELRAALRQLRTEGISREANGHYGLVLAGGGGKGAYQIGALRALRRFGIHLFDPIAGTSVGALNGVLVAQGDLRAATRIWRQLGTSQVLAVTWTLPIAAASRVLLAPFLLLRYRARTLSTRLLRFETRLAYLITSNRGNQELAQSVVRLGLPLVLIAGVSAVLALLFQFATAERSFETVFVEMMALSGADPSVLAAAGALLTVAILCYALMVWSPLAWLHNLLMDKLSLTSNRPLQELVDREVNKERLDTAALEGVYVTVAHRGVRWRLREQGMGSASVERRAARVPKPTPRPAANPAEQENAGGGLRSWWKRNVGAKNDFGRDPSAVGVSVVSHIEMPVEEAGFVAGYQNLRRLGDETEIRRFVVQSAGLPEVFPRRSVGGAPAVDGGVVDNLPLAPVLERGDGATIVVVDLGGPLEESDWLAAIRQRLETRSRSLETGLATYRMEDAQNRDQIAARLRARRNSIATRKVTVLPIRPSIGLGNLVTGTMNFSRRKARALMWLGYCDALAALRRGPIELAYPAAANSATNLSFSGPSGSGIGSRFIGHLLGLVRTARAAPPRSPATRPRRTGP